MTKGSIVHKILEVLAQIKLQSQTKTEDDWLFEDIYFDTPVIIHRKDLLRPSTLSDEKIQRINSTRINKWNYKDPCDLKSGHVRYGVNLVELIIEKVYEYYKTNTDYGWKPVDFKDVTNWTWMALDYKDGMFDPRKRDIVEPEIPFDITFNQDWAKYDFEVNGKRFEGQLALKGTIDLITKIGEKELEIVDWKGLPVTTPIPTITGWKTMGELSVEDEVFDEDRNPTTIIGKSEKKIKPCYKIIFYDKTSVVCDDEHLWKLDNGEVVSISDLKVGNYINKANRGPIKAIEYVGIQETQCIMVDSSSNTYLCTDNMIPTHNTGQRLDWSTGKTKDYKSLCKDTQLMIYYYAAKKLFPSFNIITTIFFIRDGGPFTICFDDETIKQTEKMIQERFKTICQNIKPKPIDRYRKSFKCTKICDYYKMQSPDGKTNMCQFIEGAIKEVGINQVTNLYNTGTFNKYQNPGEI